MKMTTESQEIETLSFAKDAAKHFAKHTEHTTFTRKDITPGCLFAIRWGLQDDCVLIIKLDDDFEPICYQQIIRENAD